jgi:hypothetical protein
VILLPYRLIETDGRHHRPLRSFRKIFKRFNNSALVLHSGFLSLSRRVSIDRPAASRSRDSWIRRALCRWKAIWASSLARAHARKLSACRCARDKSAGCLLWAS